MHTDSPALVAMERNRVMQFVAPYMTWQPCGPYSTYNWSFSYNPYMELSLWGAPLQLDDHELALHVNGDGSTADQAAGSWVRNVAHAMRDWPVLSSGVPPGYEYQLQMQSMQSTLDMLETAPAIVSDSTLLHWSESCKFVTLGMD